VTIRPVEIGGKRQLQFSYFDGKKDVAKNYAEGAEARLDELLALPFKSINVQSTARGVQIQFTRKGKAIIHRHRATAPHGERSLRHDRSKDLLLPADNPDPYLTAIGIMTSEGKVRARMRSKFRQINEFLKLVAETGEWDRGARPIRVIDCGCGSAHLTFAVYHYLSHVLGMSVHMQGIDINAELIEKQVEQSRALGWEGLSFQVSSIVAFEPAESPDVVLSLHACDTATDEALAQAVKWQSKMIFAVPCCHHHLQEQIRAQTAPPQFQPVLRHGILKERLGDVLTDAFRAQILRVMGYRSDVVEFISNEHTAKNLMIRAIKGSALGEQRAMDAYIALKAFWRVEPYLEHLLGDKFSSLVT
jgi:SAM-dependent methyltransferase